MQTEVATLTFLENTLSFTLQTAPRDGHVAYSVWPCSVFLLDSLVGWRIRESQDPTSRVFDLSSAEKHIKCWWDTDAAARRFILDRLPRKNLAKLFDRVSCIDLGSGTGVVGLGLHKIGVRQVALTDMDKCMTLLDINLAEWKEKQWLQPRSVVLTQPLHWQLYAPGETSGIFAKMQELHRKDAKPDDVEAELVIREAHRAQEWLIACDCVYDTTHIGKSPIVPILADFLTGENEGTIRVAFVCYESRDQDIESSFWYQVTATGTLKYDVIGISDATPSEGNELEATTYNIFAVTRK